MHDCDEINSESEVIYETSLIRVKSIRTKDNVEEAIIVEWKPPGTLQQEKRVIRLSTLLEPHQLAPLFSGGEWAGTRLWDASVECIHYLYGHYIFQQQHNQQMEQAHAIRGPGTTSSATSTLIELGCGLGVPGMLCSLMGLAQHVVLTDQGLMLNLLERNINANFNVDKSTRIVGTTSFQNFKTPFIQAKELSWSRESLQTLLLAQEDYGVPSIGPRTKGFDYVIVCDCIFEPLYGESWKLLADVIDELLCVNSKAIVLVSCERRTHDGVDKFILRMEGEKHVASVNLVLSKGNIELYKISGHETK
jgi:hypothetical protein